jgi:succinyl-CoA synthetase alpha subunit
LSIFVDENTRVVVQGITGRDGSFHANQMIEYGTKVVSGVTPGKGGTLFQDTIPVFNTVREAAEATGANTSVIYVRAPFAFDAVCEAADAGVSLVVCITEGIPVRDVAKALPFLAARGTRLIGPNCPGIISPGKKAKVGILPVSIFNPGPVGVVSRSGTLTYEVVFQLARGGLGQSTCIGIGGDPLIGTNFIDALGAFEKDPETEAVVLIGEIGGTDEQEAAEFIAGHMKNRWSRSSPVRRRRRERGWDTPARSCPGRPARRRKRWRRSRRWAFRSPACRRRSPGSCGKRYRAGRSSFSESGSAAGRIRSRVRSEGNG